MDSFDQSEYDVRLEWGMEGVRLLSPSSDVLIVVHVLSFGTAVDVALARGARVIPWPWVDAAGAEAVAARRDAVPAVGRSRMSRDRPYSLSPASLEAIPSGTELLLPSPNGGALCVEGAARANVVLASCLRNATAVARAAASLGGTVALVPAGERWPDGRLRPAVEDLIGAGAVLSALGPRSASPEARAAQAAFESSLPDLERALADCSSGRELRAAGFAGDVEVAAQLDASAVVPLLAGGVLQDAADS